MWRPTARAAFTAAFLLASLANALPHGDEHSEVDMNMDMGMGMGGGSGDAKPEPSAEPAADSPMSYFAYGQHSGTIIAHVAFMILAWCFVLPAGETTIPCLPLRKWHETHDNIRRHAQCCALSIGPTHPVRLHHS